MNLLATASLALLATAGLAAIAPAAGAQEAHTASRADGLSQLAEARRSAEGSRPAAD